MKEKIWQRVRSSVLGWGIVMVLIIASLWGYDHRQGLGVSPLTTNLDDLALSGTLVVDGATTLTGGLSSGASLVFEGTTANEYETTLTVVDPTTPDKVITLPDATGTVMLTSLATNAAGIANSVTGGTNQLIFEGATGADGFQMLVTPTDITGADKTITLPNATGTVMLSTLATNAPDAANSVVGVSNKLEFEGATADEYETWITPADPTADRTVTLANASGTVMLSTLATNAPEVANSVTGGTNQLIFEGATGADTYQLLVTPTEITGADKTLTLPNATGTAMISTLSTNAPDIANSLWGASNALVYEGSGLDAFETSVVATNPTGARTITWPDASGTVLLNPVGLSWAFTGASFATTITAADPSVTRTVTLANASGTVMLSTLATNAPEVVNSVTGGTNQLIFEGATGGDGFQLLVTPTDITGADKTLTLPAVTGAMMVSTLATNSPEVANSVTGGTNQLIFEGATGGDGFQLILTPTDITGADKTLTLPAATGVVGISTLATNAPEIANSLWFASNALVFEGSSADGNETSIVATNPTAARTITLPDSSGTVALTSQNVNMTLTANATGGNAGAKVEFVGLPRIKLIGGGQGTNPGTQTISLVDDSPIGEWAPVDSSVTESEGSATSVYKYGASSYHAAFAAGATAADGIIAANLGAAAAWNDMESCGLLVYSTSVWASGDLTLVLTDDGGARTYDIPALTAANVWTWLEVDITTGDLSAISDVAILMSAAGETALVAFDLYVDIAYVWDSVDEEVLGVAIQQDGVLGVINTETGASLVELTDYIVHYESGADFLVYITDQSAADIAILVAY